VKWRVSSVSRGPSVSLSFGMFGTEDEHRFHEVDSFSGRCSGRCKNKNYFYHVAVHPCPHNNFVFQVCVFSHHHRKNLASPPTHCNAQCAISLPRIFCLPCSVGHESRIRESIRANPSRMRIESSTVSASPNRIGFECTC
jgi:hypothetical protein